MEVFVLVASWEEYLNVEVKEIIGVFSTIDAAKAFRDSPDLETTIQLPRVGVAHRGFSIYRLVVDQPVPPRSGHLVEWTPA